MLPEKMVKPTSKLNGVLRISMTTLLAATTWHLHTEKAVETNDTYHIVLTLKKRGTGGLRLKLKENCPAERDTQSDLTVEAHSKITVPLH